VGTRTTAACDAVGNKWNEKGHEMKKEEHMQQSGLTGMVEGAKNAMGAACDKVSETVSGAKYEVNKNIAENPNNTVGTRVQAANDAVGNKMSEKVHETKKDQQMERAGLKSETP